MWGYGGKFEFLNCVLLEVFVSEEWEGVEDEGPWKGEVGVEGYE